MTLPAKPQPRRPRSSYLNSPSSTTTRVRWLLVMTGLALLSVSYLSTRESSAAVRWLTVVMTPPNPKLDDPLPFTVAIYLTTHLNQEHVDFLTKCWPSALRQLPLLHQADLIVYTSSHDHDDLFLTKTNAHGSGTSTRSASTIGFDKKVVLHHYNEIKAPKHHVVHSKIDDYHQKQHGSIAAVMDPYALKRNWKDQLYLPLKQQQPSDPEGDNNPNAQQQQQPLAATKSWFDGYDWIIRMHPDVLIRRDDWLISTMKNTSIDAILVDYDHQRGIDADGEPEKAVHADFYAFRPHAMNVSALIHKQQLQQAAQAPQAEPHLYAGFQDAIEKDRVAWLPNVEHYRDYGRVTGPKADVVHWHDVVKRCPNYFEAHDGKHY